MRVTVRIDVSKAYYPTGGEKGREWWQADRQAKVSVIVEEGQHQGPKVGLTEKAVKISTEAAEKITRAMS